MATEGAGEYGSIVVDVPHVDDNVRKARQAFPALICCQDDEAPDGAFLAVQRPLSVDLASDLIDYELALSTLAMEGVPQGLLVGILIRVRRCYLERHQHRENITRVFWGFFNAKRLPKYCRGEEIS